jgi:hypothetical protein
MSMIYGRLLSILPVTQINSHFTRLPLEVITEILVLAQDPKYCTVRNQYQINSNTESDRWH